jgi:hypothetical protein
MRKVIVFLISTTVAALVVACAPPAAFTQVSEDTYLIKRSDKAGIFGNAIEMREDVIREANEFAESKGKIAEKVVLSETPVGFGRFATVEYTFRLVDKQPAARDSENGAPEPNKDIYTELMKLDDLRERGLLTDEEFQAQKRKLLEQN